MRFCFSGSNGKSDKAEMVDKFDDVDELETDRGALAQEDIESFLSYVLGRAIPVRSGSSISPSYMLQSLLVGDIGYGTSNRRR